MTDVIRFAHDLGLIVFMSALDPDVRAALVRHTDSTVTSLYLNDADPEEVQRLACGHACALFLRRSLEPEFGFIIRAEHLTDRADPESRVATRFATALTRRDPR